MDSDEASSSQATKSHSGDECDEGCSSQDMLMRDVYQSKEDIVDAVRDYHARALRNFKVIVSDKRRYKAVCTVGGCGFVAQFAFKSSFKRPSKLSPHTCPPDLTIEGRRRFCTATFFVRHPELREYFLGLGRKVSPILFKQKAEGLGLSPTYMNCVNACKKLVEEVFGSDATQYQCIPSYVEELNKGGHKAACEVADGVFCRLVIAYREGLRSFSQYSDRGLSVDGTFLKTTDGGTLLIACFRNGNNELQIVGVAIVSIENQTNWEFFLRFLMSNLEVPPAFIISDRDKGLVPAVMALDPSPRHFFCFRHLMENFNHKFKSKVMKNAAWAWAMSRTESEFENSARILIPDADRWLLDVGKEKWSLCFSSSPRYGTLTSNNVESINGVLRGIRKLPVLDCLMVIERYVESKWVVCSIKAKGWGLLTHRASNRVTGYLSASDNNQVTQYSESAFIVLVKVKRGEPPVEYAVQLTETQAVCTCGFEQDMKAPCARSMMCLRHIGKEKEVHRFFDDSWKTSTYVGAYTQESAEMMTPPVLKSTLTMSECSSPKITKRRGRPRKHQRRESQAATLALEATAVKRLRCSTCGEKGHNKRCHKCKDSKT